MRSPSLAIFCVLLLSLNYVSTTGYYTIVAPESIRPHIDYQISVTLHNDIEPTTVRLSIEDGIKYKNEKEVIVSSNNTELVTIHIDDLDVTKGYKLVAEGLSGIIFKNESALKVESKNVSLFIQTDKAIYKPSESIKFRVLVLDSKLRPIILSTDTLLNIHVTDPEMNRIKQWKNITPKNGVFSDQIQLSDLPPLGHWTIIAEVENEKVTKNVEVAEYVLPKFEVTIDSAKEFSVKDGKVRAIIRSKYTYGKFVKGEAVVSLTPVRSYYTFNNSPLSSVIKSVPIDGKGSVEFDVNELKLEFDKYLSTRTYKLHATVIEELTGRNYTAEKEINIHSTRYEFNFNDINYHFTSGLPVTGSVSVTHHDGSPILVNDETKSLIVGKIFERYKDNERVEYYKTELNSNGTAEIKVPTSLKDVNFYLIVKYLDEEKEIGYFSPYYPITPSELHVKILTKNPIINKDVFIEVQSKNAITNFTYQVVSHGKIFAAGNVAVPNRKYHVFKFKPTFELAPKATVIVYRFQENDIISATVNVKIDKDLNNFVKLKLSSVQIAPGKDVDIDVSANPKSIIGLAGVDQSVLLLKQNEDLTKDGAFRETEKYQEQFHDTPSGPWSVPNKYYGNSYWSNFENNNVVLITNAKQDDNRGPISFYRPQSEAIVHKVQALAFTTSANFGVAAGAPPPPPPPPQSGTGQFEPPRIRSEFPETWLWETINDENFNGTISLQRKVPDTITSWVITAFSLDSVTGLGLTKAPKTVKVFQPFFVSLNIPYSVKRGEVVAIPVVVFNYMDTDVDAEVVIHNENSEYEFLDNESDQSQRKRSVKVVSNNGVTASFLVRFNAVGAISIKVTATSAVAGDGVSHVLHVEPEGVPQFVNKAVFVDLRKTDKLQAEQSVELPEKVVPGSVHINVNVLGDLLGGTIKNLENLIRLPTGCGEQNMLKLVPNIVVLNYWQAAGSPGASFKDRAVKNIERGYQRQLTYRHNNGSFSSFGNLDKSGSTWLTAFVVKTFQQAKAYVDIDESVIDKALSWLATVQAADGSFPEVGQIFHSEMQGGSSKGVALTAYTLIAFLNNKQPGWKYQATEDKALNYIVNNLKEVENDYALAVVAYALQIADHSSKGDALEKLIGQSISKGDFKLWSKTRNDVTAPRSKSIDVEITSYGVLAFVKAERLAEGLPYFKWLLDQRNDQGGFYGSQDTVVGLEALATYAQRISSKDTNLQIKVSASSIQDKTLSVNADNALLTQSVEIPSQEKSVQLSASGHGFALFQLSYRYNLNNSDVAAFQLKPTLTKSTAGHITVQVCASYTPKLASEKHSNMVVLEVPVPSGFVTEKETLNTLLHHENVKLVETKNGETVTDIYIEQMTAHEELCVDIEGYRTHKVAEQKPVAVRIYDYYDDTRKATEYYQIPPITSCDICEGDECPKSCHSL